MKPKPFAALAVVTAVMVVVAVTAYAAHTRISQVRVAGAALFPGLVTEANRIAKITIVQGKNTLILVRDKERWSLENRGGYPAKPETVRALLLRLAEAELVEAKTRSAERYSVLELEDPRGPDPKSRLLQLLDDKGETLGEVVIGKKRSDAFGSSRGGTYVRKPGDAQTWLVNAEINASSGVRDWVQPSFLDLPAAKIKSATFTLPGEEPLKIVRDATDSTKYSPAVMPAGKKLKDTYTIGAMVRGAGSLDLDDVRKPTSPPEKDVDVVEFEVDGGLAVTLRVRKEGEDYWVSAQASGAEGEAQKSAQDIMRRVQGWEFKLSSVKAQSFLKRRADLFEAAEQGQRKTGG